MEATSSGRGPTEGSLSQMEAIFAANRGNLSASPYPSPLTQRGEFGVAIPFLYNPMIYKRSGTVAKTSFGSRYSFLRR